MDIVQNCDSYINIPSSQTCKSYPCQERKHNYVLLRGDWSKGCVSSTPLQRGLRKASTSAYSVTMAWLSFFPASPAPWHQRPLQNCCVTCPPDLLYWHASLLQSADRNKLCKGITMFCWLFQSTWVSSYLHIYIYFCLFFEGNVKNAYFMCVWLLNDAVA
jgi:hypothetical protein